MAELIGEVFMWIGGMPLVFFVLVLMAELAAKVWIRAFNSGKSCKTTQRRTEVATTAERRMIMLKDIDLTNKCGSCCNFKAIGGTTQGECLQNPYGEDVVHDPEHPYWIVQRSRIKCRLYNTRPQTNADRIRAMSDEELAAALALLTELDVCVNSSASEDECNICPFAAFCSDCVKGRELEWLQQPADGGAE